MEIPFRTSVLAALVAVALLGLVFALVRSRRLQPRYALLWLLTGAVVLVLALWRDLLGTISGLMGIAYPPSALFVLASLFVVGVLLHYSTVISRLSHEAKVLAQRLALLEHELAERDGGERPAGDRRAA